MRIVVNDIAADRGGALTILESFYQYVRDLDDHHEWIFLLGSDLLKETPRIRTILLPQVKRSWVRRLAFDLALGRKVIASLKPDLVFSLQNTFTYGLNCPQVVYIHQSLPFQEVKNFSFLKSDEWILATYQHLIGALIKRSARRADRVVVQTEWMRDAVIRKTGIQREWVVSVPPNLDDPEPYRANGAPDPATFFYPTSDHFYKNNDCIYSACRILEARGLANYTVVLTVDGALHPQVRAIGHISHADALERMSKSTLIFPSLIETFGLPLAEGRQLGTLILAADLPYAREVLDGYPNAHFFDPRSPAALASLMDRVLRGEIERLEWDEKSGHSNSWLPVVDLLTDPGLYRSVAK